jgi:DegV family protein with EDD domain
MKTAIVTDSTCDIPMDLVERLSIYVVPNILIIDGKSIADDPSFSRQEFYARLPTMGSLPTTATASSGTYLAMYEGLFQQGYEQILSLHVSRSLSGIFNAASVAAQSFSGRVFVIDSQQVSLGLGFQVLAAAEAARRGLGIDSITEQINNIRRRLRLIAMLDTLDYVRRSGRVSWARASLGSFLNLKPFIEVKDGKVYRVGEARTRNKGIARLVEMLGSLGPLDQLAILHTNAESDASQLLESMRPQVATHPLLVNVTTVIGTHVGPNGLGFVSVTR